MSNASRFVTGQVLAVDGGWSIADGQIPRREAAMPGAPRGPIPSTAAATNIARKLAKWWTRLSRD
jgi:hypothetical protein